MKTAGTVTSLRLWMLIAAFAAATLSLTAVRAAQGGTLRIHIAEEATVTGDVVTLGQIASFHPDTDPRVASLKDVEVSSAPAPGNTHRFNNRFLNYKVGSVIRDQKEEITLEAPPSLVIHRTAQVVTSAQMEEIFRDHILKAAPWPETDIIMESIRVPEDLALPEGALRWNIRKNGNTDYLGNVSAALTFYVDSRRIRRVPVSGRVSITREVVRAAGNIQRGDVIATKDVEIVEETTMRRHGEALVSKEEAVGKQAARRIRAGSTLTSAMVEYPPVVERGSSVIILAENDSLRITTRGEALQDGRQGESIRVRNLQSGKEFSSIVTGPGWVAVEF
ncbi:MAG: flagellar basal body P-ring formation chaperone FlgA [Thermodesulfobacteriota bacterium]